MGHNRWIFPFLITCATILTTSRYTSAQALFADSASSKISSHRLAQLAVKCNVATSQLSGESERFPIHRTTSLPLTTIGVMIWSGEPFTYYFTTGLQTAEYQFKGNEYKDRMTMLWGYFGVGFMIGSGKFKLFYELDPIFRIHQWYNVYARESDGRHWVHATPLDLFPFLQFRNDVGMSFKIADFWFGFYYQFSLEKARKPNVLQASNLHFRSFGATIWIPMKKIRL